MKKQLTIDDLDNKYLKRLIKRFEESAMDHGWEMDQGSEKSSKKAEEDHKSEVSKLVKYLNKKLWV